MIEEPGVIFEVSRASGLGAAQFPMGRREGDFIRIGRGYAVEPGDTIIEMATGERFEVWYVEACGYRERAMRLAVRTPHLP